MPKNIAKNCNLFTKFGVEFECAIVDKESLNVKPLADHLLYQIGKTYTNEVSFETTSWSNELALHQIEIKNTYPASNLNELIQAFQNDIQKINVILDKFDAKLMPTGAHPWMNPRCDTKIWPHENNKIYNTYHRIFNCYNHGFANLQSIHLNLPFANDEEFAKLHTAIRLILPLIPALCASTPILDGHINNVADNRLQAYANNQRKIPSIAGQIIPETALSKQEYQANILNKIYADIAPHDQEHILQFEWLNSRGAIARFDRNTIEIRIADTQECTLTSIALLDFITAFLKACTSGLWIGFDDQLSFSITDLVKILKNTIKAGLNAKIDNCHYLAAFGYNKQHAASARELLMHVYQVLYANNYLVDPSFSHTVSTILEHGNLAERIITALNNDYSLSNIKKIYQRLCACLDLGIFFR